MIHTPSWPWIWASWMAGGRQALGQGGGHGREGSSQPAAEGDAAAAQPGRTTAPSRAAEVLTCNIFFCKWCFTQTYSFTIMIIFLQSILKKAQNYNHSRCQAHDMKTITLCNIFQHHGIRVNQLVVFCVSACQQC